MLSHIVQFICLHYWAIFGVMFVTLMYTTLKMQLQIDDKSMFSRPTAHLYAHFDTWGVVQSALHSGFAMGSVFYAYGLIYLPCNGPMGRFLTRVRSSALTVWHWYSPLMLLPWCLEVWEGLWVFPTTLLQCCAKKHCTEAENFWILTITGILLWIYYLSLSVISVVSVINLNMQLIQGRILIHATHELRAYAQEINDLLGYEMLMVTM
ncbi:hypothetical protein KR018_010387 [Drosophila ironensis]|nr:hypothetical protein KR018_010387 [Drosophila ironensis]